MMSNDEQEHIVAVAIIDADGSILHEPPPARHWHLLHKSKYTPENPLSMKDQGFLTSFGRFVGRIEGGKIAIQANQILYPVRHRTSPFKSGDRLFSEDLW